MRRSLRGLSTTVLLLCIGSAALGSSLPHEIRLSTTNYDPYYRPDGTGFEDRLLKEMFGRLGVAVRIVPLPGARSLVNANEGVDDGTAARVAGVERAYPNLVPVPEVAYTVDFTVFTLRPTAQVARWADLEPYDVAFINGWKILERNVTAARSVTKVNTLEGLFTLLKGGRADMVLTLRWIGLQEGARQGLTTLRALRPPIAQRDTYILLHRRHAALARQAAEALRDMKRDGTYARIQQEVLAPLERP